MKTETREKLALLEQEVSDKKGEFSLFGLFLREDAQDEDKWDLLVSALWLDADKKEGLAYLAKEIQKQLKPDELMSISRIVVLEKGDPILEAIHKTVKVKHGKVEVKDSNFSGIQITQACISTSSAVNPTVR
jgi:predicted O-linked N-acetylglucosamine transferase (SPINDLY family)